MSEELSEFRWAGVEQEAFCLEDCAAVEVLGHVFHELIAISRGWIGRAVQWYGDTYGGELLWD